MMILKLNPTAVESDRWRASRYRGEVLARAKDEKQARTLATQHFRAVSEYVHGADTPLPPWPDPELVTCEVVDDWGIETDGPVEILSPPVNHAVADLRREAGFLRVMAYQAERRTEDVRALGGIIHRHLLSQVCTVAIEVAGVDARITDWANEVKKTGEPDLLPKIAPGLRKIADELDRQATWPN